MLEKGLRNISNWFGRQAGYVKRGIEADVSKETVVYQKNTVEEIKLPERPDVTLRRTTIDEVIVEKKGNGQ